MKTDQSIGTKISTLGFWLALLLLCYYAGESNGREAGYTSAWLHCHLFGVKTADRQMQTYYPKSYKKHESSLKNLNHKPKDPIKKPDQEKKDEVPRDNRI
jgi:hypothetical protein